jgi:hypothetical protein
MLVAGIGRMYYGASAQQSEASCALPRDRHGGSAARARPAARRRRMPAEQKLAAEAMVLEKWADAAPDAGQARTSSHNPA